MEWLLLPFLNVLRLSLGFLFGIFNRDVFITVGIKDWSNVSGFVDSNCYGSELVVIPR
jgi:hypothetical protein